VISRSQKAMRLAGSGELVGKQSLRPIGRQRLRNNQIGHLS
jgi:hypothetical protein